MTRRPAWSWTTDGGAVRHLDSGRRRSHISGPTVITACGIDTGRAPSWTLTGPQWMLPPCVRCWRVTTAREASS